MAVQLPPDFGVELHFLKCNGKWMFHHQLICSFFEIIFVVVLLFGWLLFDLHFVVRLFINGR